MDFEKDKFGLFNLATAIRAPTTPFHSRGSKFNLSRGEHDVCKVMTFLSVLALPPFFIELAAADATRAAAAAFYYPFSVLSYPPVSSPAEKWWGGVCYFFS